MNTTQIRQDLLYRMLLNGSRRLKANMETIDSLNVFPVPDGDTGTNMSMTLEGGVHAVTGREESIGAFMRKFSRGSLLSARGNSGVILCQFFRGLAEGMEGLEALTPDTFGEAMERGRDSAYTAVIHPTEGTILTVIREGAAFLREARGSFPDFETCFVQLIARMEETLRRTPELLPVLREAGVIDSGGAGLICIFEGMEMALRGELLEEQGETAAPAAFLQSGPAAFGPDSVLEYGYCTEFILQLLHAKTDIAAFRMEPVIRFLESIGNSIVAIQDGDLVKVHVHTFEPEKVLGYARQFGEFVTIKIENMSVQHNEIMEAAARQEAKDYGCVAVTSGAGVAAFFREMGVDAIIEGGQTQNPSVEDFLRAFSQVNARYIVVFPNNSNVIMAARQAAELWEQADVRVIPTSSIAQGYAALSIRDPTAGTIEEFLETMEYALDGVITGYVTTATRDTCIGGVEVRKGDWIGLDDDTIRSAARDPLTAALELLQNIPDMEDREVLTVFVGKDVTPQEEEALTRALEEKFPLLEVGMIPGGQEVYAYIFSLE